MLANAAVTAPLAQEPPTAEHETGEGSGLTAGLAMLAALLFAGYMVFRRAMQRPQA